MIKEWLSITVRSPVSAVHKLLLRAANLWQIGNCDCSSIISVVRPNCVLIGGAIDCCGVE